MTSMPRSFMARRTALQRRVNSALEIRVRMRLAGSITLLMSMYLCYRALAIDHVRHLLGPSGEKGAHVAGNQGHDHLLVLVKQAANVRSDEDIGQIPQRAFRRKRLGGEHIKARTGDLAILQSLY